MKEFALKVNARANISPEDTELFHVDLSLNGKDKKTVVLYFQNTPHSPTHGNSTVTQAEIMGLNIKFGKWGRNGKGWAFDRLRSMVTDITADLERELTAIYSTERKKARREFLSAARGHQLKRFLSRYQTNVNRAKASWQENKDRIGHILNVDIPDLEAKNNEIGLIDRNGIVEYGKQMRALRRELADRRKASGQLWGLYLKASSVLRSKRAEKIGELTSAEMGAITDALVETIRAAEESGNRRLMEETMAKLEAVQNPFLSSYSFYASVERFRQSLHERFQDALYGAKAPPLSEKTLANRRSRGYDGETPLVETGEFVESLMSGILDMRFG